MKLVAKALTAAAQAKGLRFLPEWLLWHSRPRRGRTRRAGNTKVRIQVYDLPHPVLHPARAVHELAGVNGRIAPHIEAFISVVDKLQPMFSWRLYNSLFLLRTFKGVNKAALQDFFLTQRNVPASALSGV
jgi:hypothetical protein